MKKFLKGFIEKSLDDDLFTGIASTKDIDRDGESIDPNGWDLKNFLKNPVMLWAHDQRIPPIGKVFDVNTKDEKLRFAFKFAPTKTAKEIKELVKGGFLNAFSVGFLPLERDENTFTKTELLEISIVGVPSNPNALVMARSKGIEYADKYVQTKGIVPFKSYTIAPENIEFDYKMETESSEVADLKQMSTWYDSAKEDNKESYKLIHHSKNKYAVIWRGVSASMASLLSKESEIPESDRQGVYEHLAKHYKQFGKEAPEFRSIMPIIKFLDSLGNGGEVIKEPRRVEEPLPQRKEERIKHNSRVIGRALQEINRILKK